MVLHRRRDAQLAVGDKGLDGELLADEALLEDDAVVVGTPEVFLGLRGGTLVADDTDALAAGEAGGLDREVAVVLVDVLAGGVHVLERLEVRTAGDVVFPHEPPLERLVRLDASLRLLWPEGVDAGVVQRVGDPGCKGRFGSDDGERRVDLLGVGRHCRRVCRVECLETVGQCDNTRVPVAGTGVQLPR